MGALGRNRPTQLSKQPGDFHEPNEVVGLATRVVPTSGIFSVSFSLLN